MKLLALEKSVGLLIAIFALLGSVLYVTELGREPASNVSASELEQFESFEEFEEFIEKNEKAKESCSSDQDPRILADNFTLTGPPVAFASGAAESADYSTTNVQVEGVDEGDIVKNDGKYAYIVSSDRQTVYLLVVYPADEAKILSRIQVDGYINELYLGKNKLAIVGYETTWPTEGDFAYQPYYSYIQETFIAVYDITNKEKPTIDRVVGIEGSYLASRMVDGYIYLIATTPVYAFEREDQLPVAASSIYYYDGFDYSYSFTTIVSVNVNDKKVEPTKKVFMLGSSSSIYASLDNIYLTHTKYV